MKKSGLLLLIFILLEVFSPNTTPAQQCNTEEVAKLRNHFSIAAHEATDCELKGIYENNNLDFQWLIMRYEDGQQIANFLVTPNETNYVKLLDAYLKGTEKLIGKGLWQSMEILYGNYGYNTLISALLRNSLGVLDTIWSGYETSQVSG